MKTAAIWVAVALGLLFILGRWARFDKDWTIVLTGALMFWLGAGALFAIRGLVRFIRR